MSLSHPTFSGASTISHPTVAGSGGGGTIMVPCYLTPPSVTPDWNNGATAYTIDSVVEGAAGVFTLTASGGPVGGITPTNLDEYAGWYLDLKDILGNSFGANDHATSLMYEVTAVVHPAPTSNLILAFGACDPDVPGSSGRHIQFSTLDYTNGVNDRASRNATNFLSTNGFAGFVHQMNVNPWTAGSILRIVRLSASLTDADGARLTTGNGAPLVAGVADDTLANTDKFFVAVGGAGALSAVAITCRIQAYLQMYETR